MRACGAQGKKCEIVQHEARIKKIGRRPPCHREHRDLRQPGGQRAHAGDVRRSDSERLHDSSTLFPHSTNVKAFTKKNWCNSVLPSIVYFRGLGALTPPTHTYIQVRRSRAASSHWSTRLDTPSTSCGAGGCGRTAPPTRSGLWRRCCAVSSHRLQPRRHEKGNRTSERWG